MGMTKHLRTSVVLFVASILVSEVLSDLRLEEEIIGKCQYYQTAIYPEPFQPRKNCTLLWQLFKDAFAFQPLCNVSHERYLQFVQQGQHSIPDDKFVFWESIYTIVMRYSNRGMHRFSIADTLPGFIGDSLKWCGSDSAIDGVEPNTATCPGYDSTPECPSSAEAAFWNMASAYYAMSASGDIEIMMSAESAELFTDDSTFATWELPNLNSSKVTSAKIILAKRPNRMRLQTCSSDAVQLLQLRLTNKGIPSTCVENPRDLLFLLCSEDVTAEECQLATSRATPTTSTFKIYISLVIFTVTSIIFNSHM